MPPGVFDRALPGAPHPVLDPGEGLLDRTEIRRVRGEEPEPGPGLADRPADGPALVAGKVVKDHEVAGAVRGGQTGTENKQNSHRQMTLTVQCGDFVESFNQPWSLRRSNAIPIWHWLKRSFRACHR